MNQKIIRVGNSAAVTIPKELIDQSGVSIGAEVNVSFSPDVQQFLIEIPKKNTKREAHSPASKEFTQWLETFLEEDGELLDELADR